MEIYKASKMNINRSFGNKNVWFISKIKATKTRSSLKEGVKPYKDFTVSKAITRNFYRTSITNSNSSIKS